jgi:hypothetical protein
MIRKSVQRFSLATNAERVCAEIMRKQQAKSAMAIRPQAVALLSAHVLGVTPNERASG